MKLFSCLLSVYIFFLLVRAPKTSACLQHLQLCSITLETSTGESAQDTVWFWTRMEVPKKLDTTFNPNC